MDLTLNRQAGVAALVYVAVMLGVVRLCDLGRDEEALLIWSAASFCLGWITRNPLLAILPLLAIPIADPFGYADGSPKHDPLPLWAEMLFAAPIQGASVIAGFGGQLLYGQFRKARV